MMFRVTLSVSLLLVSAHAPAVAQTNPAAADAPAKTCKLSEPRKRGSSMLGGMLGGLANRALGRSGVTSVTGYIPVNSFATALTDAIACKLDAQEQKQAATATTEAVRGGVGSSASWTSATRPGVSGSSTVKTQTASAGGGNCMIITDVIIVDGEETSVEKRMCRSPGGGNYVLSA
jgi:predicted lipid-binding transport protein (Tim44 family)